VLYPGGARTTAERLPSSSTVAVIRVVSTPAPNIVTVEVAAPDSLPLADAAMTDIACLALMPVSTTIESSPSLASLKPVLSLTVTLVAVSQFPWFDCSSFVSSTIACVSV